MSWKRFVPKPAKRVYRSVFSAPAPRPPDPQLKYSAEMQYWIDRFKAENGRFGNGHYKRLMLAMAEQKDAEFLRGQIVADFACGPRGSLCWADTARIRIGIDVLVDSYARFNLREHDMCYVASTETTIPLPTGYVDLMYTLNSIDHVDNFDVMCAELVRVTAPGGLFCGSFNLEEPTTVCEPQTLTEENVRRNLLDRLEDVHVRMARMNDRSDTYAGFFDGSAPPKQGTRLMWARGRKPVAATGR